MIRSLFLCGLLFIPTVVTAQDARSDSKPFQINDWCEPQTVVAGRVSLKNLDIAGAIDQVIAMAPQMDPAETSAAIPAKGLSMAIMRSIMDSGVNDVYITLSVTDLLGTNSLNPFSPTPVFWLPTPDPAKTAAVVNVFFSQFPAKGTYVLKSIPGAVVLGPANTLARIEQGRVSNRTDLTKALETIDDWTLTVQASLPEATREEVAAIWPAQLPAPVEFVSPKQLIQTVHSLTFQSRLGKQLAFQLAANCADAKAAQSTHQTRESNDIAASRVS